MKDLTLEIAREMLKLIADNHDKKSNCDKRCNTIDFCEKKDGRYVCKKAFLDYWQQLAEKSLEEQK